MNLKLVIFDVDGTLVDSQGDIHACMVRAFETEGLAKPSRSEVRAIVGLSLPQAVARLSPGIEEKPRTRVVETYKAAYADNRRKLGAAASSPLFDGAREVLERLHAVDHILLAVATGKSRRGLDFLLEAHELSSFFVSKQVADDHPSKPHPSMVLTALSETGLAPGDAVVVGDTSFDMDMAHAAGVPFIGVAWGYHPPSAFRGARFVLDGFGDLPGALQDLWRE